MLRCDNGETGCIDGETVGQGGDEDAPFCTNSHFELSDSILENRLSAPSPE